MWTTHNVKSATKYETKRQRKGVVSGGSTAIPVRPEGAAETAEHGGIPVAGTGEATGATGRGGGEGEIEAANQMGKPVNGESMKIKFLSVAIATLLGSYFDGSLLAQTNQVSTNAINPAIANTKSENRIILPDYFIDRLGNHYRDATVMSVEPDSVELSYYNYDKDLCRKKIKLTILPDEVQKMFGYNSSPPILVGPKNPIPQTYEQKMMEYNMIIERREWEAQQAQIKAKQEAEEAQARKDQELREREVAAKEQEANKPPIQVNVIQLQQQQQ